MKCKKCQTELEQGVTLCPECGTENAENGKTGLGAGKIALLVILAVAAIAVVVALFAGGNIIKLILYIREGKLQKRLFKL